MGVTRYIVPAVGDDDRTPPLATKKTAVAEAERRAARWGEGVEVYTINGKLVHTVEAPLIEDDEDELPSRDINEDAPVAEITGEADFDTQIASILDQAVEEGSLTAEQRAEIETNGLPELPENGDPTDTWVVTDTEDNPLAHVTGETMGDANKAARALLGTSRFALRRLGTLELAKLAEATEEPPADDTSDAHAEEEAAPETPAAPAPSTPQGNPGDVHFQVASRLATWLIVNRDDTTKASALDALEAAPLVSAGKGQARAVTCTRADATALRDKLSALHTALGEGTLAKVPFRTTTTARHMGRIDAALEG